MSRPFWRDKSLETMDAVEWEALCDGCGRCCLHKLEDEDTGIVHLTAVACRLLDLDTCRCNDYVHRCERVSDCVSIRTLAVTDYAWLPPTCAYRLLANGEELPAWHPLVSGSRETVHAAGISVRGRAISELDVAPEDLQAHLFADCTQEPRD